MDYDNLPYKVLDQEFLPAINHYLANGTGVEPLNWKNY
jgi:hypothetical protein